MSWFLLGLAVWWVLTRIGRAWRGFVEAPGKLEAWHAEHLAAEAERLRRTPRKP